MHDDDRIRRAMEGEAQAIEALLASQQDRVHRLAARMATSPSTWPRGP